MSAKELPPVTVVSKLTKPHPERLYLLGGTWVAIVTLGVIGMSALVDPNVKLPLIDPLLQKFAPQMLSTNNKTEDVPVATETKKPVNQVVQELPKPAVVKSTPAVKVTTSPTAKPKISSSSAMPTWVYLAIIASCMTGSSLITYLLYQSNQQPTSPKKAQQKRRSPLNSPAIKSQKIRNPKPDQPQSKPQSRNTPVNVVPAQPRTDVIEIAPLHISTPTEVNPPQVRLEPIIDPQPVAVTQPSRVAQLAAIAESAKQNPPKSLVERMDIRRRGRLAPFLQDL